MHSPRPRTITPRALGRRLSGLERAAGRASRRSAGRNRAVLLRRSAVRSSIAGNRRTAVCRADQARPQPSLRAAGAVPQRRVGLAGRRRRGGCRRSRSLPSPLSERRSERLRDLLPGRNRKPGPSPRRRRNPVPGRHRTIPRRAVPGKLPLRPGRGPRRARPGRAGPRRLSQRRRRQGPAGCPSLAQVGRVGKCPGRPRPRPGGARRAGRPARFGFRSDLGRPGETGPRLCALQVGSLRRSRAAIDHARRRGALARRGRLLAGPVAAGARRLCRGRQNAHGRRPARRAPSSGCRHCLCRRRRAGPIRRRRRRRATTSIAC